MHHFASGIFCTKYKFTQTKCRTPKRLLIMVESNSVSNHMSKLTKSDDQEEGVWFDYHLYDCWQNWTTQSPVTNWLKLWPNLRKKLVFDDAFLWKKNNRELGKICNNRACVWHILSTYKGMTCQVSYYTSQLQAWHTYCPISTQIGLVTNHVLEICYSFD